MLVLVPDLDGADLAMDGVDIMDGVILVMATAMDGDTDGVITQDGVIILLITQVIILLIIQVTTKDQHTVKDMPPILAE